MDCSLQKHLYTSLEDGGDVDNPKLDLEAQVDGCMERNSNASI